MSSAPAAEPVAKVSGGSTFMALYRLLLRLQVTPLRIVGIGGTGESAK